MKTRRVAGLTALLTFAVGTTVVVAEPASLTGAWRSPSTPDGWSYAMVLRAGGACDLQALHATTKNGVDKAVMIDWKCTYSTAAGAIDFIFLAYAEAGSSRKDPSFNYARVLPPGAAGPSPPAHVPYRLGRTPRGDPLLITLNPDGTEKATMTRGGELSLPLPE